MTEVKEIGKVIKETGCDNEGCFNIKRKIIIDGHESEIIPIRAGEVLIPEVALSEEEIESIKSKVKADLLKYVEQYIEIFVIENENLGTLGVRADITILSDKNLRGEHEENTN